MAVHEVYLSQNCVFNLCLILWDMHNFQKIRYRCLTERPELSFLNTELLSHNDCDLYWLLIEFNVYI